MKMFKNGLEGDAFAISRIPIPSPPCMKREADLRYVARPRELPVQVHPLHHPAEAVAVAVAEPVDGVDAREQRRYKNRVLPSTVPKTMCGQCRSGMAPRRKRKRTTTRRRRKMKGGTVPYMVNFKKGFELLTTPDTWKTPSKAEIKSAKRQVADYKRQYRASGTRDSYNTWLVKKGYAKKTGCSVM